jgi:uncharacterized protein YbjT (DUF2867 family)
VSTLIVGASGKLGSAVARKLLAKGERVRAVSRMPARIESLRQLGAETAVGDLTDQASLRRACEGVTKVFAAAHSFLGTGRNAMRRVDDAGNRGLIDAARAAGVRHFVFTSACFGPNDPVDFFRVKHSVEQYLRTSGLPYTILRPGAFMEDHAERIGGPVLKGRRAVLFGGGKAPANFVAVKDVAEIAVMVLRQPPRNEVVWIGGPENLSAMDVVGTYARVSGRPARVAHLPIWFLRVVRSTAGRLFPVVERIIDAGIFTESGAQTIDMAETLRHYPLRPTSLAEFIRERHPVHT